MRAGLRAVQIKEQLRLGKVGRQAVLALVSCQRFVDRASGVSHQLSSLVMNRDGDASAHQSRGAKTDSKVVDGFVGKATRRKVRMPVVQILQRPFEPLVDAIRLR